MELLVAPPGLTLFCLPLYCAFQCCAQRAMQLKEEMVQLVGYNRFLRTRDDLEVANWMRAMRGEEPIPQVGFLQYSFVTVGQPPWSPLMYPFGTFIFTVDSQEACREPGLGGSRGVHFHLEPCLQNRSWASATM